MARSILFFRKYAVSENTDIITISGGFPGGSVVKNLPEAQEPQEMQFQFLGQEDLLEEEMATHSSILAWRIPWTEYPSGLQFMGSQRIGHD